MHKSFKAVVSSNIEGYLYRPANDMLLIAFKSGGTYAYEGVSSSTVSDFVNALSKGQFFQSNIKNRYVTSKLDDSELETLLGGDKQTAQQPRRRALGVTLDALIQRHPILAAVF